VKLSIKKIRTESLFTICFSIVALLPATAVSQGKAPIPDSKTMETYLRDDQLGKYIKMQAEKSHRRCKENLKIYKQLHQQR
jgi:hypothetical protein